jgi:hypothetical protein
MANYNFDEHWKFSNEIRVEYGQYTKQSFIPMTGKTFKSGRPKWIALFTEQESGYVHKHEAMQLVSKKTGKPYYKVCVQTMDAQERDREIALNRKKAAEEEEEDELFGLMDE